MVTTDKFKPEPFFVLDHGEYTLKDAESIEFGQPLGYSRSSGAVVRDGTTNQIEMIDYDDTTGVKPTPGFVVGSKAARDVTSDIFYAGRGGLRRAINVMTEGIIQTKYAVGVDGILAGTPLAPYPGGVQLWKQGMSICGYLVTGVAKVGQIAYVKLFPVKSGTVKDHPVTSLVTGGVTAEEYHFASGVTPLEIEWVYVTAATSTANIYYTHQTAIDADADTITTLNYGFYFDSVNDNVWKIRFLAGDAVTAFQIKYKELVK